MNLILGGSKPTFINRPPGLHCYVCGREYGSASLRLHVKTCLQQWDHIESQKSMKNRKPHPTPPQELLKIYEALRHGRKIDLAIIEAYNKKAIETWEKECCYTCQHCNHTIAKNLRTSHENICTRDFPYHRDFSYELIKTPSFPVPPLVKETQEPQEVNIPKATETSPVTQSPPMKSKVKEIPSFGSIKSSPQKEGEGSTAPSSMRLDLNQEKKECQYCNRKFAVERIETHKKACESLLNGQETHEFFVERAKKKKEEVKKFKEFEDQFVSHEWKRKHEELVDATEKAIHQHHNPFVPSHHPKIIVDEKHLIPRPIYSKNKETPEKPKIQETKNQTAKPHIPLRYSVPLKTVNKTAGHKSPSPISIPRFDFVKSNAPEQKIKNAIIVPWPKSVEKGVAPQERPKSADEAMLKGKNDAELKNENQEEEKEIQTPVQSPTEEFEKIEKQCFETPKKTKSKTPTLKKQKVISRNQAPIVTMTLKQILQKVSYQDIYPKSLRHVLNPAPMKVFPEKKHQTSHLKTSDFTKVTPAPKKQAT